MGFLTRSDTNRAVQPQKNAIVRIEISERYCTIYESENKGADWQCGESSQLICTFVFGYSKSRFSHDLAQSVIGVSVLHNC